MILQTFDFCFSHFIMIMEVSYYFDGNYRVNGIYLNFLNFQTFKMNTT